MSDSPTTPLPDEAFEYEDYYDKFIDGRGIWGSQWRIGYFNTGFTLTDDGTKLPQVNVEIYNRHDQGSGMVDAYFHADDLDRLGILFQYLARQAREKAGIRVD